MRSSGYRIAKFLAVFVFLAVTGSSELKSQTLQIDSATADWIEGFVDFVKWEENSDEQIVKVGILDAPEIATYLERRIQSRTTFPQIKIVRLKEIEEIRDINVLFVGSGHRKQWDTIARLCKTEGILSIGQQEGFIESGGCIEFSVNKNRIIFYANHTSLRESEVEIRSQLLELAKNR